MGVSYLNGLPAEQRQVALIVRDDRTELVVDDLAGAEVVAGFQDGARQLGRVSERRRQTTDLGIKIKYCR